MNRFCYKCGALEARQGPLIQGMCQRCFTDDNRLLRAPSEIEVTVCSRCGAHLLDKRWHHVEGEDAIWNAAQAAALSIIRIAHLSPTGMELRPPDESPGLELSIEPNLKDGLIEVKASGKVHELQVEPQVDEARIKFNLKRKTCDACSLKSARHYEAVLQVRGYPAKRYLEIRTALQRLASDAGKRERTAFISHVDEKQEGLDFYVNPVNLARKMAVRLKSEFRAQIKESKKLIGQERDGRRRFRFTILARLSSGGDY